MKKVMRHRFSTTKDRFWGEVFFDEEFNRGLSDALDNESMEVVEQSGEVSGTLKRTLTCTPRMDAPGPVRKILGDSMDYTETGEWNAETGRWEFSMVTAALGDKMKLNGAMWAEECGDEIERVCEIEFSVKMFGMGKVIEKFLATSIVENQEKAARFTKDFISSKGL